MVRAPVWEIQLETYNKSSHEPKWGQMPAKFRTCSKCASKFPNQNLEPNHLTCWEHMKLNQCIFEALWCLWYIICLCIVLVHSNVCWYGRNFISSLRKEKGEKLKWTFLCLNLWKKFTPQWINSALESWTFCDSVEPYYRYGLANIPSVTQNFWNLLPQWNKVSFKLPATRRRTENQLLVIASPCSAVKATHVDF